MRRENSIFRERAETKAIAFHCQFDQFCEMQRMAIRKLRDLLATAKPIGNNGRAQPGSPDRWQYGVFANLNPPDRAGRPSGHRGPP